MRPPVFRPLLAGAIPALLALLVWLAPVAAQEPPAPSGVCQFQFNPANPASPPRVNALLQPSGQYNSFIGGRFRGVCPAQTIVVLADSLEYYAETKLMYLIGNVHYEEPRLKLDAQRVTYWQLEEHLRAEQKVDATLPSGTNLKGPLVDYYRAVRGIRPQARMVAPGRPTIRIVSRDSTGRPTEPVTVRANTVVMDADSLVYASGQVELTRPDVDARADSATVDNGRQWARLMRQPVVHGKGERPFTLYGRVIDIFGRNRTLARAIASDDAKAVSQDVTLTADTLDFRLADGKLQRAFAWGRSTARAHATSSTYDIVADSLDVQMPGQRLDVVYAVRGAFAQSVPDTTKIHSHERDWLRGDTIIAMFDTTAGGRKDTARVHIRELVAHGSAQSFYQVASQDSAARRPAVNYVKGRDITVSFATQQVQTVTVTEKAAGVYLDPAADGAGPGAPPPGDTSGQRSPQRPRSGAPSETRRRPPPAGTP